MSTAEKTLARMRANPRDWRLEDLEAVAARLGIQVRKPGGSHVIFRHDLSPLAVSVPARRPIKPVYVTQFLALAEDVEGGRQ